MKHLSKVGLLILLVAGIVVRVSGLENWYFSPDDVWHLLISQGSTLKDVVIRNSMDAHPILTYVILHFMQLVSDNSLFLRLISLVPGILFIPSVYVLGQKFYGKASGYFLAFFSSLGMATVLQSQVIRQYSFTLLMMCWAMYFWKDLWDGKRKNKYIFLFSLLSLFSIMFHYVSIMVIFSLIILILAKGIYSKANLKFNVLFFVVSVVPIIFFLVWSYGVQNQGMRLQTTRASELWLRNAYPNSVDGFASSYFLILDYYSFFSVGWVILTILTAMLIYYARKKEILLGLVLLLIPVLINLIMSYGRFYPFVYTRHSIHLWLAIMLPLSGVFQMLYSSCKEKIMARNISTRNILFFQILLFFAVLQVGMANIETHNFYRTGMATSEMEFPVSMEMINNLDVYLDKYLEPNDVLIADNDASDYFAYWSRNASNDYVNYDPNPVDWQGHEVWRVANPSRFPKLDEFESLYQRRKNSSTNTIYVSLGWMTKDKENFRSFIFSKPDLKDKKTLLFSTSGLVMGYKGKN